jgi:hypothetical protein
VATVGEQVEEPPSDIASAPATSTTRRFAAVEALASGRQKTDVTENARHHTDGEVARVQWPAHEHREHRSARRLR